MLIHLEQLRQDTPGCQRILHLNNAGAALMPQPVLQAMTRHLELEATIGGYEAADQQNHAIEHTYDAIAQLIGANRDEIAVVENATRAWDMAFYSIPLKPGDRILTSVSEYASNTLPMQQRARQTGATVEVIPNDASGTLSVEALEQMLDERVRLIAMTHVPTNGGLVNPAAAVGALANKHNILYLLDACQSVGQMPLDVSELGCDFLSATGRKFLRGPRGIGFLYVRQDLLETLEPPFLDLHAATWVSPNQYELRGDARRFENWECNYAAKIGLGVAAEYAMAVGLPAIWERVQALATQLRQQLQEIPGITLQDLGNTRCGIVSFTLAGIPPELLVQEMRTQKINISYSPWIYTPTDMTARRLDSINRASVHYYNTEEELERFCQCLAQLAQKAKQ